MVDGASQNCADKVDVALSGELFFQAESRLKFWDYTGLNLKNSSDRSGSSAPQAKGKVTLDMVALEAGVSPSTVSRILNGTAIVSEFKKNAVDEAIKKLGFIPNPVARGLAGGRTMSVGVITQAIDSPFYGAALRGIEETFEPAGYSPLFVSGHWNAATEMRCLEMLRSRYVDGVIVLTGRPPDETLSKFAQVMPIVVTGRTLQAPSLFSLNFDNMLGGMMATQHLIQLGHRQIAFITGSKQHPDSIERFSGYKAGLEAAGVRYDPKLVIQGEYHEVSGLMAVESLLDNNRQFTAIFAANDQMAIGASLGLHRRSIRVPDDVSLIGFDDLPASTYGIPPLSTIHQPAYELGQIAATAMLQLLAGKQPDVIVPEPRLIVRESSSRMRR